MERLIAVDTETHGQVAWSIQVSVRAGSAIIVLLRDVEAVGQLVEQINYLVSLGWELVFHHSLADAPICEQLGINVGGHFRDTLQESYQLCSLPQGLKSLVYRLFGHEMRSWQDVVWPASIATMKAWLDQGIAREWARPRIVETELKMGKCVACGKRNKRAVCSACGQTVGFVKREESANAVEAILQHVKRYAGETEENEKPYNPWKKLPEMREKGLRGRVAEWAEWARLDEEVGPMPLMGIGNCDEAEAVQYGAADADWTLRLADRLEELRGDRRWVVDPQDYDE